MTARYDTIGINYDQLRLPDHRITRQINHALGTAANVLNVGAGTGSYEPADRQVTAVEPSIERIRKGAICWLAGPVNFKFGWKGKQTITNVGPNETATVSVQGSKASCQLGTADPKLRSPRHVGPISAARPRAVA